MNQHFAQQIERKDDVITSDVLASINQAREQNGIVTMSSDRIGHFKLYYYAETPNKGTELKYVWDDEIDTLPNLEFLRMTGQSAHVPVFLIQ